MIRQLLAPLAAASLFLGSPASAATILDQILPGNYSGATGYASQSFETAMSTAYNVNVIDDFTIASAAQLTSVEFVMAGYNGFTSLDLIWGYMVQLYTSPANAGASLWGNVWYDIVTPSAATITALGGDQFHISVPFVFDLDPGTYWIGVMPWTYFGTAWANGQTAIVTNGAGTGNAIQVNPGGGFGNGVLRPLPDGRSAAYRVNGTLAAVLPVPEPGTWGMLILGFGLCGGAMRVRRRAVALA